MPHHKAKTVLIRALKYYIVQHPEQKDDVLAAAKHYASLFSDAAALAQRASVAMSSAGFLLRLGVFSR